MTVDLDAIVLDDGAHETIEDGGCAMEWVAAFAGLPHSDHPACTDPVVASYVRTLNDWMPDDQRQRLIPYIPKLAATKNGVSPQTRAFLCADRAVRVFAAMALKARGMHTEADKLSKMTPITDRASALTGRARAAKLAANLTATYAADAAAAAADAGHAAGHAANADAARATYAAAAAADAANAACIGASDSYYANVAGGGVGVGAAADTAHAAAYAADAANAGGNAAGAAGNAAGGMWDEALELLDDLIAVGEVSAARA